GAAPIAQAWKSRVDLLKVILDSDGVVPDNGAKLEVLLNGQPREDLPSLRDLDEARLDDAICRRPVDPALGEGYLPSLGLQKPADGIEGGGLARPVAAEQRHDVSLRHRQAHPPQALGRPVRDTQVLNDEPRRAPFRDTPR